MNLSLSGALSRSDGDGQVDDRTTSDGRTRMFSTTSFFAIPASELRSLLEQTIEKILTCCQIAILLTERHLGLDSSCLGRGLQGKVEGPIRVTRRISERPKKPSVTLRFNRSLPASLLSRQRSIFHVDEHRSRHSRFLDCCHDYLREHRGQMLNPTQAQLWFQQADRAIVSNNIDALRTAIHQLVALLPQQQEARGYGGGTIRAR